MSYDANHDVAILVEHFKRIAAKQPDGSYKCTFKDVFKDEQLEQLLESLVCIAVILFLCLLLIGDYKRFFQFSSFFSIENYLDYSRRCKVAISILYQLNMIFAREIDF